MTIEYEDLCSITINDHAGPTGNYSNKASFLGVEWSYVIESGDHENEWGRDQSQGLSWKQ